MSANFKRFVSPHFSAFRGLDPQFESEPYSDSLGVRHVYMYSSRLFAHSLLLGLRPNAEVYSRTNHPPKNIQPITHLFFSLPPYILRAQTFNRDLGAFASTTTSNLNTIIISTCGAAIPPQPELIFFHFGHFFRAIRSLKSRPPSDSLVLTEPLSSFDLATRDDLLSSN